MTKGPPSSVPEPSAMLVTLTAGQLAELVRAEVAASLQGGHQAPPALIDKRALAFELGVSERSVDRLREQGLPTVRVLDAVRFDLENVLRWLADRDESGPADSEPATSADPRSSSGSRSAPRRARRAPSSSMGHAQRALPAPLTPAARAADKTP